MLNVSPAACEGIWKKTGFGRMVMIMMYRKNLFIRFLLFFGIIKREEVSSSVMCKNAQSVCNYNCYRCAWNRNGGAE